MAPGADLPPLPCYLNGDYTVLPEARVSVMDRGFLLGDGVYEVIPVYGSCLFRFEQHMARLERSLAELRIPNPHTRAQWYAIAERLVQTYARDSSADPEKIEQMVYLQVTRGVALREHAMLPGLTPTVFAMTNVMKPPSEQQRREGVACVTAEDFRWQKAHIKTTSLLGGVLARQISVDAGAAETILFRDGYLSEAAASNVWIVQGGVLQGPPRDHLVLEGIRYGLLQEICALQGIPFELRRISRAEVLGADEVLLSSATKEVLPVTRIDGQPVGDGQPGTVYDLLYAGYQAAKLQARLRRPTL
ncbi:MAG: aminotransferase class IV [Pseudomonadota bacterium]|jgi:D-alanine transaminase|uniref:aminotransferase class IV n=1 Tax=Hylemonella sp. TaxID=2066020 RepID=UPI0035B46906